MSFQSQAELFADPAFRERLAVGGAGRLGGCVRIALPAATGTRTSG